jgi:hypothetical protein
VAIYTTFLLCEPHKLAEGFPGWLPPLDAPVVRTVRNPFTGAELTLETQAPDWPDTEGSDFTMPPMQVISGQGDYQTYLERRIPSFVQSLPHWCIKNLTSLELVPLVEAAGIVASQLDTPLYSHPSCSAGLEQFDQEFVALLKGSDDATLEGLASRWAATMSTSDYTHSISGDRIADDWTNADAMSLLRPLAALAKKQSGSQRLYLLTEA